MISRFLDKKFDHNGKVILFQRFNINVNLLRCHLDVVLHTQECRVLICPEIAIDLQIDVLHILATINDGTI